jgi:hypothetical protein
VDIGSYAKLQRDGRESEMSVSMVVFFVVSMVVVMAVEKVEKAKEKKAYE